MNNSDIAKEWFVFAKNDLESAKFLLGMKPKPLEIVAYHCQQSSEKYLKGFIALNGGKIVKTHDLLILNKICRSIDEDFKNIEDDCIELVDYGVQVRYPFQIDIEENDTIQAIESAEHIQKFVLGKSSLD